MTMKKYFFMLLLGLGLASCQESLEERCAREAETFTRKNCPAKLSDIVTIDSMTFDRNTHTLGYYYTVTADGLDATSLATGGWRETLLRELKNTPTMKPYLEAGYGVDYVYYQDGDATKRVFEAHFTEKDYK